MSDLPKPEFRPDDVEGLIRDHGRPLDPKRKQSLMDKLKSVELEAERPSVEYNERDRDDEGR
jgi:hypothetical protein